MSDARETWKKLRKTLNGSFSMSNQWEVAIDIYNMRFQERYFTPIQNLLTGLDSTDKNKGEGFSILTILCSLIESYAAFRVGKIFKLNANANDPIYYGSSKTIFTQFLVSEDAKIFEDNFYTRNNSGIQKNTPFNADDFYKDVRCSLIHEARTKGHWTINAYSKRGVKNAHTFLEREGEKIKIYRTVLFHKLKKYHSLYLSELRENNQKGEQLRCFFARKMDNLFDIDNDNKFTWWQSHCNE